MLPHFIGVATLSGSLGLYFSVTEAAEVTDLLDSKPY